MCAEKVADEFPDALAAAQRRPRGCRPRIGADDRLDLRELLGDRRQLLIALGQVGLSGGVGHFVILFVDQFHRRVPVDQGAEVLDQRDVGCLLARSRRFGQLPESH